MLKLNAKHGVILLAAIVIVIAATVVWYVEDTRLRDAQLENIKPTVDTYRIFGDDIYVWIRFDNLTDDFSGHIEATLDQLVVHNRIVVDEITRNVQIVNFTFVDFWRNGETAHFEHTFKDIMSRVDEPHKLEMRLVTKSHYYDFEPLIIMESKYSYNGAADVLNVTNGTVIFDLDKCKFLQIRGWDNTNESVICGAHTNYYSDARTVINECNQRLSFWYLSTNCMVIGNIDEFPYAEWVGAWRANCNGG